MTDPKESAIPSHYQAKRTCPARMPEGYVPHGPAHTTRFPKSMEQIAIAVIGVQGPPNTVLDLQDLEPALRFVRSKGDGSAKSWPSHWDLSSTIDNQKAHNLVVIVYWPTRSDYEEWSSSSGFESWWKSLDPGAEQRGWFREVLFPTMNSFETIFSDNVVPEGAAHMREAVSDTIWEHEYFGSMRDRMPISQTDPLDGQALDLERKVEGHASKQRVKVPGRQNLCVIRSGQDWSDTASDEREKYLKTMHPVLKKGMDFLRDKGANVNCFECRFMSSHEDGESLDKSTDKTFGLAYFNDMASLEDWAKSHKTHLAIYHRFFAYVKEMNFNPALRLWHEVFVLTPDQQIFEYVGCHDGTGMLSALQPEPIRAHV